MDKIKWYKRKKNIKRNGRDVTVKCKAAEFCSEFGNNFPPTDVYNVGSMVGTFR